MSCQCQRTTKGHKEVGVEKKGKEEDEKRRSHQIKARQEERRRNWTGARTQKAGVTEGREEERGRCSAAASLGFLLLFIQRWPRNVLTHGPIHQVESCTNVLVGGESKRKKHMCIIPLFAHPLTHPHTESVSQWVSVTVARDALAVHLQNVRVSEIQVKVSAFLPPGTLGRISPRTHRKWNTCLRWDGQQQEMWVRQSGSAGLFSAEPAAEHSTP